MSFENLLKTISSTLRKITRKLNGHFSSFNDEDLFQEALLHLWIKWQKGDLDNKTESYILQGCYFHLKNYIRKTQNKISLISFDEPIDERGNTLAEILSGNLSSPAESLKDESAIEEINARLTKREKEVLHLSLKGMTTREIGKKFGISHVMVVKIRNRIKDKYKEGIEDNGYQKINFLLV